MSKDADHGGRLYPSTLNLLLMAETEDTLGDKENTSIFIPTPIFTGFIAVSGTIDEIKENKRQDLNKTLEQQKEHTEVEEDEFTDLEITTDQITGKRDLAVPALNSSYKIDEENKRIIIAHGAVETTKNYTPAAYASAVLEKLQQRGINLDDYDITHIMPEVGKGRTDGLFGVNHIRLRIAKGNPIDIDNSTLIDPRNVAQRTLDTVNCGRYIATMVGVAIGLAEKNQAITTKAFKESPIVQEAAEFTTLDSLGKAMKYASEHPLAIGKQQDAVALLKEEIGQMQQTYQLRAEQGRQYKSIWPERVVRLFGGRSASEKSAAASAILQKLDPKKDDYGLKNLTKQELDIASRGRLGEKFKALKKALQEQERERAPKNDDSGMNLQ